MSDEDTDQDEIELRSTKDHPAFEPAPNLDSAVERTLRRLEEIDEIDE
jgi:hypothetical protein